LTYNLFGQINLMTLCRFPWGKCWKALNTLFYEITWTKMSLHSIDKQTNIGLWVKNFRKRINLIGVPFFDNFLEPFWKSKTMCLKLWLKQLSSNKDFSQCFVFEISDRFTSLILFKFGKKFLHFTSQISKWLFSVVQTILPTPIINFTFFLFLNNVILIEIYFFKNPLFMNRKEKRWFQVRKGSFTSL